MSADLHEVPVRMERLPRDERGLPVPWHRASDSNAGDAYSRRRCWTCGEVLGVFVAFVVPPESILTGIAAEPPSHRACGMYAARAEWSVLDLIPVSVAWVTRRQNVRLFGSLDNPPFIIRLGKNPEEVAWFCEGREATREEAIAAIESSVSGLREYASEDGAAGQRALEKMLADAMEVVPA